MICAICGDTAVHRHHVVKRQRIVREWHSAVTHKRRGGPSPWSLTQALADARNLVPVCGRCHKEESPMPLPAGFAEFVAEYGFEGLVPRHLAR